MTGDLFKAVGMELVLEAEPSAWKGRYMILAMQFFKDLPDGAVFNGEQFRLYMLRSGLGEPHHPNAWGAMAAHFLGRLFEDHSIERHGVEKAVSARAHARRYPAYRKISGST